MYKGQEIVVSHDCPYPEKIWYIEENGYIIYVLQKNKKVLNIKENIEIKGKLSNLPKQALCKWMVKRGVGELVKR